MKQLFPLLFAVFVSMLGVGIISPLLPIYAEMLGAGGFAIGIIFGLFSLSRAVVMPFYGRLSDIKGRKIFIVIGLASYCVISFGYVYADSVVSLGIIRLLHGLASAAILPVIMAYVGDVTPEGQEGRYTSVLGTSLLAGFGSGPIIGGFIKDSLGINTAFYVMGALVFIGLLLVIVFVEEPKKRAVVSRTYPFRRIFSSKTLRALFIYRFVSAVGRSIVFAFLPLLAHNVLSLSAAGIGFILSAVVLTTSVFQVPFGYLADRFSRANFVAAGGMLSAACLLAIAFCTNFFCLALVLVLLGFAGAVALPSLTALAVNEGRDIGMGSVMGIFNLAMSMGQSIGPFAAGYMMQVSNPSAPFYVAGATVLAGTVLFFIGIRKKT